jgi:hypothetical protein
MNDNTETDSRIINPPPAFGGGRTDRPSRVRPADTIDLPNGDRITKRRLLAKRWGVSERTLQRMGAKTVYVGNVAYCSERSAGELLAEGLKPPKRRRR